MKHDLITEGKFTYLEKGEGTPIIILHGLMGGLSNFDSVTSYFSENGYKVVIPELPVYTMPLIKTGVKSFANYLDEFIEIYKGLTETIPVALRHTLEIKSAETQTVSDDVDLQSGLAK